MTMSKKFFWLAAFAAGVSASGVQAGSPADAGQDYDAGLRCFTGVTPDYACAEQHYRRAAMRGHLLAQYNLALIYDLGYGVAPNRAEAEHLYRQAAANGSDNARMRLAALSRPAAMAQPGINYASAQPLSYPAPAPVSAYLSPIVAPSSAAASAFAAPAVSARAADYQAAVAQQDSVAALRVLEQARSPGGAAAMDNNEAQAMQELARLALLSNDRGLAQSYLQRAAAAGSPEAAATLNQLAQGADITDLSRGLGAGQVNAMLGSAGGAHIGFAKPVDTAGLAAAVAGRAGLRLPEGAGAVAAAVLSGDTVAMQQAAVDAAKQKAKDEAMKAVADKIPVPGASALFGLFSKKKKDD